MDTFDLLIQKLVVNQILPPCNSPLRTSPTCPSLKELMVVAASTADDDRGHQKGTLTKKTVNVGRNTPMKAKKSPTAQESILPSPSKSTPHSRRNSLTIHTLPPQNITLPAADEMIPSESEIVLEEQDQQRLPPSYVVHRARFLEYQPSSINYTAFSPNGTLPYLALSRENGDIELWNIMEDWHLERKITGGSACSVEALAWSSFGVYSYHEEESSTEEEDDDTEEELELNSPSGKVERPRYRRSKDNLLSVQPNAESLTAMLMMDNVRIDPIQKIPSTSLNKSIRDNLKMGRLFSSGLSGYIVEWNVNSLKPLYQIDSLGGAVWSMAISPRSQEYLACGCEDGTIRLFRILPLSADVGGLNDDNGNVSSHFSSPRHALEYIRHFDAATTYSPGLLMKQGKRKSSPNKILSLDWSEDEQRIVMGGSDSQLKVFDVRTGRCLSRINLRKKREGFKKAKPKKKQLDLLGPSADDSFIPLEENEENQDEEDMNETLVWVVKYLPRGGAEDHGPTTLVTGDSLGHVNFWDGDTGTLIQSFTNLHESHVLSIAVSPDGQGVFSAGVDYKIVEYRLFHFKSVLTGSATDILTLEEWRQVGHKRVHSHDIRSLGVSPFPFLPALVSGGIDCQLGIHDYRYFATSPTSSESSSSRRIPHERIISAYPQSIVTSTFASICSPEEGSERSSSPLVLFNLDNMVQLWELGSTSNGQASTQPTMGSNMEVASPASNQFEMNFSKIHNIVCNCISQDGLLIAVSTRYQLHIFYRMSLNSGWKPYNHKQYHLPPARAILFPYKRRKQKSKNVFVYHMIFLTFEGSIIRYEVNMEIVENSADAGPIVINQMGPALRPFTTSEVLGDDEEEQEEDQNFSFMKEQAATPPFIHHIATDRSAQYLGVASTSSIELYSLKKMKMIQRIPSYCHSAIHLLYFHPTLPILIVCHTSNQFYLYDLESRRLDGWSCALSKTPVPSSVLADIPSLSDGISPSSSLSSSSDIRALLQSHLPPSWLSMKEKILGVSISQNRLEEIIFWGHGWFAWLDLSKPLRLSPDNPLSHPQQSSNSPFEFKLVKEDGRGSLNRGKGKSYHYQSNDTMIMTTTYRPIIYLNFINHEHQFDKKAASVENQLLIVERPWTSIVANLPKAFRRSKYGQ